MEKGKFDLLVEFDREGYAINRATWSSKELDTKLDFT